MGLGHWKHLQRAGRVNSAKEQIAELLPLQNSIISRLFDNDEDWKRLVRNFNPASGLQFRKRKYGEVDAQGDCVFWLEANR
jgi:hypothetical protein